MVCKVQSDRVCPPWTAVGYCLALLDLSDARSDRDRALAFDLL